jgi:hypothetical protein
MTVFFKSKEYDLVNECIVDGIDWRYAVHKYYINNKDAFSWYAKYNFDVNEYYTVNVNSDKAKQVGNLKILKRNLDKGKFVNISKKELDKMIKKVRKK